MSVHEFALYYAGLSSQLSHNKQSLNINDAVLITRLQSVLRVSVGDVLILFDADRHARITISQVSKKGISCSVQEVTSNRILQPSITVILPLLKKDALEDAIYSCVALGANDICLVKTQKTQHVWSVKDKERLLKIVIAAAEQSKNFAFPVLHEAQELQACINATDTDATKMFFDPKGSSLLSCLNSLVQSKPAHIIMMIGPEGDLTSDEKMYIKEQGFTSCALTPTVLRSKDALIVGLGALRSV